MKEREGWRQLKDKNGQKFGSFEWFALETFGYKRNYVDKLVKAELVMRSLSPIGDVPLLKTDPLFALYPFTDEQRCAIYRKACEAGRTRYPTAPMMREAIAALGLTLPVEDEEPPNDEEAADEEVGEVSPLSKEVRKLHFDKETGCLTVILGNKQVVLRERFTREEVIAVGLLVPDVAISSLIDSQTQGVQ